MNTTRAELRTLWTEELDENPPASLGRDILALGIQGARTARGGAWHDRTVRNLLARAADRGLSPPFHGAVA
jgi:hypothetical protein